MRKSNHIKQKFLRIQFYSISLWLLFILSAIGTLRIFNENGVDFVEENGVKFSNTSYKDWNSWYNYGFNDSLLTYKSDYDCDGYLDDTNLLPLESNWYVEYDGKWEEVGDRVLTWNLMTGELYELSSGEMILLDDNAIVYDENYEYVY